MEKIPGLEIQEHDKSKRILNIKTINTDKSLIDIKIYDFDKNSKLISVTTANYGNFEVSNTKNFKKATTQSKIKNLSRQIRV